MHLNPFLSDQQFYINFLLISILFEQLNPSQIKGLQGLRPNKQCSNQTWANGSTQLDTRQLIIVLYGLYCFTWHVSYCFYQASINQLPHLEVPYPNTNGGQQFRHASGSCPTIPLHMVAR